MLGLVEGVTEFIPVSSTGHLILVGRWLSFEGDAEKTFEIVIQLGAILAVLWLYRVRVLGAFSHWRSDRASRRLLINLVVAFLPAAVVGLFVHDFIKERLFDPLGMTDTHFFLPDNKLGRLATVYSSVGDGSSFERATDPGHMEGQGHYVSGPRTAFSAGAGGLSTATDYATFLQMMLNGGELNGTRILSRKTVESMLSNHLGGIDFRPGQGFGLGFSITHDPAATGLPGSVGEFGWGGAYHSTYWADPEEELVVVYLTQLIPAINLDDHQKVRTMIYQAIVD